MSRRGEWITPEQWDKFGLFGRVDPRFAGGLIWRYPQGGWCPAGPHRGPQGPNEDLAQCAGCGSLTFKMRPPGQTFGDHLAYCALPADHQSYCEDSAKVERMDSAVPFEMQRNPCHDTIAGWLWYCDEHDTHGNADSYAEAQYVAGFHREFHVQSYPSGTCDIIFTKVEEGPDG